MNPFWGFVKKEFLHIVRDVRTLVVLFGLPVAQILIFGFVIRNEIEDVSILVVADTTVVGLYIPGREHAACIAMTIPCRSLLNSTWMSWLKKAKWSTAILLQKTLTWLILSIIL